MTRADLLVLILSQRPSNYSELITLVYQAYSDRVGSENLKYWGDKNNYYVGFVEEIYELFPNAKFIQIVRDARDVATSYISLLSEKGQSKYSPDLPCDLESIATEWNENNFKVYSSFCKIDASQKYVVRYEDLVTRPKFELRRICEFLDLEFSEGMLEYFKENQSNNLEPEEFKAWKAKTFRPVDTEAVNKYKSILSITEQAIIEDLAKESLRRYKYI